MVRIPACHAGDEGSIPSEAANYLLGETDIKIIGEFCFNDIRMSYKNYPREYRLWYDMCKRSFPKFWDNFPTYTGTSICEDWKFFSNFLRDISKIDGYEIWKNNPNSRITLDKDIKVSGNKLYSIDTCMFVSASTSARDVYMRNPSFSKNGTAKTTKDRFKNSKKFTLSNEQTGEMITFLSLKEASDHIHTSRGNIWAMLNHYGKVKTVKGWSGSYDI